jgi:hypothetical protein
MTKLVPPQSGGKAPCSDRAPGTQLDLVRCLACGHEWRQASPEPCPKCAGRHAYKVDVAIPPKWARPWFT